MWTSPDPDTESSGSIASGASTTRAEPTPALSTPPQKTLQNNYFVSQSFNNCGPASLSMMLSYFNIHETQEKLGSQLRPYQNPYGDNDDKSVTLNELAQIAKEYKLIPYHRPNGNINLLKQFIAHGIPVLTRTWLNPDEDIGHYRVVKGYNDTEKIIIQDDSYQGPDITYSYDEFNLMWEKFNYEYLVIVPQNKKRIAQTIIGKNLDQKFAWQEALSRNQKMQEQNPSDIYSKFNIAIASFYLNDYKSAVKEFEEVQSQLPARTLWYQKEPIVAYYNLGQYDKVLSLTDTILNSDNRAYSELYILRGNIYKKQGNLEAARQEFETALYYNTNLKEAQQALRSLSVSPTTSAANQILSHLQ